MDKNTTSGSEKEARRQSEEDQQKFVSLADGSHEFVGMCDRELRPFYVNAAGMRLVGLPDLESACRVKVQDFFFPEDLPFITRKYFPRVLREGHGQVEVRFRHFQTGEPIWMLFNVFNIRDAGGAIVAWATVSHDITERKRMEDSLRQAKDRAEKLIQTASVIIVGLDAACTVTEFNDAAENITGFARAELVGRNWLEVLVPQDRYPHVWEQLARPVQLGGLPRTFESPILTKSGEERLISWRISQLREQGKIVGGMSFGIDITESKQAEAAYLESEQLMRLFMEATNDSIWNWDLSTGKLLRSIGFSKSFGYSPLEIAPTITWWEERLHPDDRERVLSAYRKAVASGEHACAYEYRFRRKDGAYATISDRCFIVRDPNGKPTHALGAMTDITARKQAEEMLRMSEQRFSGLFHGNPAPIGVGEVYSGRLIDVNESYARFFGCHREELIGTSAAGLWADPTKRDAVIAEVSARGSVRNVEVRFRRKTGEIRYGLLFVEVVPIGEVPTLIAMIVDISERKQAEEALRESEAKFRLLAESIHDVFWMTTPALDRMVYVSPTYEKMWGRTCASLYQQPLSFVEAIHPEDRDQVMATLQAHAREKWEVEYRILRPDGSVGWILDRGFPVRDERGEMIFRCGVSTDITERQRAKEALHELACQLNRAEEEERRHIARELHDATGQKLAALAMTLSQLQDTVGAPDRRTGELFADCLAMIEQCAQEIRTHSYLLHPPLLETLGLTATISDYAEGFSKRSGIQVTLDAPPDLERWPDDVEIALFRVVQEGLGNIHRYAGSPTARVRLACDAEQVTLEVSDQGRGMSAETLRAVQAGRGSSGIGIAGMRERLRLLGGRLEIESGQQGTTVRAIVPSGR